MHKLHDTLISLAIILFFFNWFEIILFNELLILYLKSNQIRQSLYNIVRG